MRKLLFLILLLAVQSAFAQIISKDPSFASNGTYTVTTNTQFSNASPTQNSDGSIYYTYSKSNSNGNLQTAISKITSNGIIDNSFGSNGETIINDYYSTNTGVQKQTDGKLLVLCSYDQGLAIVRLFPNGQVDNSFGTNGASKIDNIGADMNASGFGFYIQNNKIILYGEALDPNLPLFLYYRIVYRLNENGGIDTAFGNNGFITTQGRFVLLDNQLNVTVLNAYSSSYPSGSLEKYDNNGQPLTSFGNNGVLGFTTNPGFIGGAFMDSNNNIVCSNINNEIFRITPNGVYDNSFVFDSNSYPFNVGALLAITEKNGNYYISGQTFDIGQTYFISKLTSTGTIDPIFNYYLETPGNLTMIGGLIINDNNIIGAGGNYIIKFLLNTGTLSTTDIVKINNGISFENPVKQNLVFSTKEKVNKIEIYSIDGKLLKTVRENNSTVSELPKGVFIAKVTFDNGKVLTKKLIKN